MAFHIPFACRDNSSETYLTLLLRDLSENSRINKTLMLVPVLSYAPNSRSPTSYGHAAKLTTYLLAKVALFLRFRLNTIRPDVF